MAAWFSRLFARAESRRSLLLNDVMRRIVPHADILKAGSGTLPSALLDTLVFCGLALALGAWLWPQDAFGVDAAFPWLWIVPALIAMRHGSSLGVVAVALYVAAWLLGGLSTDGPPLRTALGLDRAPARWLVAALPIALGLLLVALATSALIVDTSESSVAQDVASSPLRLVLPVSGPEVESA